MGNNSDDDDSFTKPLGRWSVFYYGVGHMLNDITASCWFTYLLIFLTDIGLSPRYILDNSLKIILFLSKVFIHYLTWTLLVLVSKSYTCVYVCKNACASVVLVPVFGECPEMRKKRGRCVHSILVFLSYSKRLTIKLSLLLLVQGKKLVARVYLHVRLWDIQI